MSLILALQVSHRDPVAAHELCQLCADLEERYIRRDDCQFWICCSQKVWDDEPDIPDQLVNILARKFVTKKFRAREKGEGFPYGANMLWLSTMCEAWGQYKHSLAFREAYNGILTFEPDCTPLRRDWIDALTQEWDKHVTEVAHWNKANKDDQIQFECMGHVHQVGTVHAHLNGNMILRPDMMERKMIESHQNVGWDFWPPNRVYLMSVGRDTNLISQHYGRATIAEQEIPFLKKNGVMPALFHGVKDGSARKHVRSMLIDKVR